MTTKAIWNGTVIAESSECILVENNAYFPPDAVNADCLKPNSTTSYCPWKQGHATYFDVVAGGSTNPAAAWTYRETAEVAKPFRNYIAFWRGVTVTGAEEARRFERPGRA